MVFSPAEPGDQPLGTKRHIDNPPGRYRNDPDGLITAVSGKLQPEVLITQKFTLDQVMQGCEPFGNAMME
jgi:hypothetical protein